jgi:hypothetical protein
MAMQQGQKAALAVAGSNPRRHFKESKIVEDLNKKAATKRCR